MGKRHQGRGSPPQWVGIVVLLVVLLVASMGSGQARGGAHGFGGHHGFRGQHRFRHHHGFGGPPIFFGVTSYWGPYWRYCYPPVVVAPPAAVFIQPSAPGAVPPPQAYWY